MATLLHHYSVASAKEMFDSLLNKISNDYVTSKENMFIVDHALILLPSTTLEQVFCWPECQTNE